MIVYKDTRAATRTTAPPWLEGAADLLAVESLDRQARLFGIGQNNAHLIGERRDWQDLEDGWQFAVAGPLCPDEFARTLRWCRTIEAVDTQGRTWRAPIILGEHGDRLILVTYGGKDFRPLLTPVQERICQLASDARHAICAAAASEEGGIDWALGARWTAELLCLTHHISMEVIGAIGVVDDALTLAVLSAATGKRLKPTES